MQIKSDISKAILCSLTASMSMAFMGFFSKSDINIIYLLLVRFFFPLLIISIVIFLIIKERVTAENFKTHLLRCCFVFLNQAAFFYTCKHGSLLLAILLFNTAPLFVPILTYLFFNERSNKTTVISIFVGALGVLVILRPSIYSIFNTTALFGLVSGFSLACSQLILQRNVRKESNLSCMFWFYLILTVFSIIIGSIVSIADPAKHFLAVGYNWKTIGIIIGITLSTLSFQFFTGKSYKLWSLAKLAPIMYSSLIFSAILDFIFWHEIPNLLNILGIIIVVSACINVIRNRKKVSNLTVLGTNNART